MFRLRLCQQAQRHVRSGDLHHLYVVCFAPRVAPAGADRTPLFVHSFAAYFPIVFGPVLYFIYPYLGKNRQSVTVSPHEADFVSGSRDEEEEDVKPPKNFIMKIWAWIM